jgi:hypothetical protein
LRENDLDEESSDPRVLYVDLDIVWTTVSEDLAPLLPVPEIAWLKPISELPLFRPPYSRVSESPIVHDFTEQNPGDRNPVSFIAAASRQRLARTRGFSGRRTAAVRRLGIPACGR